MKALHEDERNRADALLAGCTEVLAEGFRIALFVDPEGWAELSCAVGARRLCAYAAGWLCAAYERQFGEPFLFSERCMTFELLYHLRAYLWVRGLCRVRHVTTLLFPRRTIKRTCRSVEIDRNDVYRLSQRIAFRYFFGIRGMYRRTEKDPYAKRIGGRYVRVPLYRFRGE